MTPKQIGAAVCKDKPTQNQRSPQFLLRFATQELREKARRMAKEEGRTVTAWINELIRKA